MSNTDFKQTPIQQLPQQPPQQQQQQKSGDSGGSIPSADPLIQNILNDYDNDNQQSSQNLQNSIPDTPDAIYNSEQSKYQDQQFDQYQQPPPEQYQENYGEYYDGYPEDGQYEEQVQLKDLPFYKRLLYYFSFDDIKKSLLVSVLFVLLSFSIVDTQLIKYIPKFATIIDNQLSLNLVGTISKGLLAGLLFFVISIFL